LLFAITQPLFEKAQIRNHIKYTTRIAANPAQTACPSISEETERRKTSGSFPLREGKRNKTQIQYITIGPANARKIRHISG